MRLKYTCFCSSFLTAFPTIVSTSLPITFKVSAEILVKSVIPKKVNNDLAFYKDLFSNNVFCTMAYRYINVEYYSMCNREQYF
jgi:hypothetical protein